jgi:hypothetical protein
MPMWSPMPMTVGNVRTGRYLGMDTIRKTPTILMYIRQTSAADEARPMSVRMAESQPVRLPLSQEGLATCLQC